MNYTAPSFIASVQRRGYDKRTFGGWQWGLVALAWLWQAGRGSACEEASRSNKTSWAGARAMCHPKLIDDNNRIWTARQADVSYTQHKLALVRC